MGDDRRDVRGYFNPLGWFPVGWAALTAGGAYGLPRLLAEDPDVHWIEHAATAGGGISFAVLALVLAAIHRRRMGAAVIALAIAGAAGGAIVAAGDLAVVRSEGTASTATFEQSHKAPHDDAWKQGHDWSGRGTLITTIAALIAGALLYRREQITQGGLIAVVLGSLPMLVGFAPGVGWAFAGAALGYTGPSFEGFGTRPKDDEV